MVVYTFRFHVAPCDVCLCAMRLIKASVVWMCLALERNKHEALFHSNWEVLMGQGEVQNWIRSRPDQEAHGAFSFFWE